MHNHGCENLKCDFFAIWTIVGARIINIKICMILKESDKNSTLFPIAIKKAMITFGLPSTVICLKAFPGANTLMVKAMPYMARMSM